MARESVLQNISGWLREKAFAAIEYIVNGSY